MSELKLLEFRERAGDGVEVPAFSEIERRGKGLRRRRYAATAGALTLVLAAGAGIVATAGGTDSDTAPPATDPTAPSTPSVDPGVRIRTDRGEDVLRVGTSTATYDGFDVRFDVPGPRWEWWGVGMGHRKATTPDDYTGAIFFLADPVVRLQPCRDDKVRPLGNDPEALMANVEPLLHLADTAVVEAPRFVGVHGGLAVHLKLRTTGTGCPDDGDLTPQLSGVFGTENMSPGFGGTADLDLWHNVLPGGKSVLVASWDLGGSSDQRTEQLRLLNSIRIRSR